MQWPIFSSKKTQTSKNGLVKISVSELTIGMLVAELDKPWNESGFIEQGFRIGDHGDIEDLRAECKHVFIKKQKHSSDEKNRQEKTSIKEFNWG